MSETATTTEAQVSPFGSTAWTEQAPTQPEATNQEAQQSTETVSTETTETTTTPTNVAEPAIPIEWLKKEFDVEDPTVLKAEREELKRLKETPLTAAEIKFENDQSKHLHELYRTGKWKEANAIIEKQERIEQIVAGEVTKENAADIIKLGLQLSNDRLTKEDIEFQYKQDYIAPKEPIQKASEDDEDFAERHNEWKEKVEMIEQKRIVAAKMAIPSLEAAKVKLVLPEIEKPVVQANEPTAEQIELQKKAAENFLTQLNSNFLKAEGFTTKVKDELVELPVSFKIPDEDKVAIKGRLEKGFDINDYMDKRWFDENSNPKIEQIITDLYQLENLDKILSGIANNSANQRLVEHRKVASNISVNGTTPQQTFQSNQNGNSKVSPFSKDGWSEKQPSLVNN